MRTAPLSGRTRCRATFETRARSLGHQRVAGVDEVGRGALFGGVVAAAVVLPPDHKLPGLTDSKLLTPAQREALAERIVKQAVCWSIGSADPFEIDELNIYQATRLAMTRAVVGLKPQADYLLIDAVRLDLPLPQESLIKGDARSRCIAAASVLAKVHRDACMTRWASIYPQYGLEQHKGYGTRQHLEALRQCGATPLHRTTFSPVQSVQQSRFAL